MQAGGPLTANRTLAGPLIRTENRQNQATAAEEQPCMGLQRQDRRRYPRMNHAQEEGDLRLRPMVKPWRRNPCGPGTPWQNSIRSY
jgi:hypothetical protein